MYQIKYDSFGTFQEVIIYNEKIGQELRLLPEYGAAIKQIQFSNGQSQYQILDGYHDSSEITRSKKRFKATVLLPFPNRLSEGQYEWEGNAFQFPINEPARGNNLHGFPENQDFKLSAISLTEHSAQLALKSKYRAQYDYFPFNFDVQLKLEINTSNEFIYSFEIINRGETAMPIGLGWHPYFITEGGVNQWNLRMPESREIMVNENLIPNGKKELFDEFVQTKNIGEKVFDTCYELSNPTKKSSFELSGNEYSINLEASGDGEGFPFWQLYTPAHRNSIAIEPMTCNVNAFSNEEGLIRLAPKAAWHGIVKIAFAAK
ncbi:MAG: aldose 1-epimerase [Saprospiraceae bacterium]